jgi:signal transduction histidine kinase
MCVAFLAMLLCVGCHSRAEGSVAQRGLLTLQSRSLDAEIPLAGDWEIYWRQLLTPAELHRAPAPPPDGYLHLPGAWNDLRISGQRVGNKGFATLRLRVDAGPEKRELGIRLFHIASAYRLWIDGRLTAANGVVGRDVRSEVLALNDRVVRFQSNGRPTELVLQISNFRAPFGGARMPILFGSAATIEQGFLGAAMLEYFLCGGMFIMGIYNVARFLFSPEERASFFFGALCLLWMLFTLTTIGNTEWLDAYFPGRFAEVLNRVQWLAVYLTVLAGYGLLWSLYPKYFPTIGLRVIATTIGVFSIIAVFAPYPMLTYTTPLSIPAIGVFVVYTLVCQTIATIQSENRSAAILILGGVLSLDIAAINDILFDMQVIATGQIMLYGMSIFAIFQLVYLSSKTARGYREVAHLSQELDHKNAALQTKIAETEQLSRQIVTVSEVERCRISQDLHDGICQQLTAMRLHFSVLKKQMPWSGTAKQEIDHMSSLLNSAVNSAYDMSIGLWPATEGAGKLTEAISELCERARRVGQITVGFHADTPQCPHQSADQCQQIHRIAQEALTNAIKHSKASNIEVSLSCAPDESIRLTVEDDGVGHRVSSPQRGAGLGMKIMAHRAKIIGGTTTVSDREGGGTSVLCIVPCAHNPADGSCPHQKQKGMPHV